MDSVTTPCHVILNTTASPALHRMMNVASVRSITLGSDGGVYIRFDDRSIHAIGYLDQEHRWMAGIHVLVERYELKRPTTYQPSLANVLPATLHLHVRPCPPDEHEGRLPVIEDLALALDAGGETDRSRSAYPLPR